MNNIVDKNLIKKRFEKSFSTYSKNAIVQEKMSNDLLSKLIQYQGNKFDKILEIGCGTGFLTGEIINNINFDEIYINDIIENALGNIKIFGDNLNFLYGDCEKIPFPPDLDLIISNATFQWIEDLQSLLEKTHLSLKEKGIIAFTTFGEQNFHQIKTITGKSLNYYTKEAIENMINEKFKIIYLHSENINVEFKNAQEILKHLKKSGVNALEKIIWTKKDLKKFDDKYNKLFRNSNGKLELTYQPLYFIAEKSS